MNENVRNHWRFVNECMAYTYYVTLMAKCTCTWLHHPLKLLTSTIFFHVPIQVNQDDFMLRLICMFLGCYLPIQLTLKLLSSAHDKRLVIDRFWFRSWTTKYVTTFYAWTNILTCFSTCGLPIQLFLYVNILLTNTWQQA